MAETAKPKTRRKTGPRKTTAATSAKSKTTRAKKADTASAEAPKADAAPAADTPASEDNGQHIKITPPEQPKRSAAGAWFLLVLLVIVSAGAGYLTWPVWKSYAAAYLPDGLAIEVKDTRVDGLSERVGSLETTAAALIQKDAVIAKLESERERLSGSLADVLSRIESLEHSIGAVKEMAKAAATAEEAAQASKSLKALNERLSKVERTPAPGGTVSSDVVARLNKLEQDRTVASALAARIAELEAAGAESRKARQDTIAKLSRSAADLSVIEGRLKAVESRPASGGGDQTSAVVLAVAQLRDAVHRGRPYGADFAGVQALSGDDPAMKAALVALEKHAENGIATLSILHEEFARLAAGIVDAGNVAGDGGWVDKALDRVSSLVKFRRVDGSGDAASSETLVAQAEKHLASGDLGGAVKAVERLQPAAAKVAKPWLAKAKARLAAEQSLASLHVHAVSLLSAAKE